jgi:heat shock protein HslJ
MRLSTLCIVLVFTLTLLVSGCTNQQPAVQPSAATSTPAPSAPVTPASAPSSVPGQLAGDWTLTTLAIQGGSAIIHPTTGITFTINQDKTLTGYDGCNNYFGTFILTGTTTPKGQGMTISGIGASKKYCADLASQEQQYLNILEKTLAYAGDGTRLTLTGEKGDALVYERKVAKK